MLKLIEDADSACLCPDKLDSVSFDPLDSFQPVLESDRIFLKTRNPITIFQDFDSTAEIDFLQLISYVSRRPNLGRSLRKSPTHLSADCSGIR